MITPGIRYANRADIPQILQLIKDLAEYERAPHEAVATTEAIEKSLFSPIPAAFCHVAEVDGRVIGISIWFLNYSTWLGKPGIYLEDLYVDPAYRSKGFGLAFLKELAKICLERDYERLQWWVLDWNQPSIEFYKSLGAEPMDEWTVYRMSGDALKKLGS
ncbi:MAG: GNAT family N-acetyltransferase [Bacteroidota bacterium]|nr:GNAT family N-acetyltransferase [Bacteroidota bacterium]